MTNDEPQAWGTGLLLFLVVFSFVLRVGFGYGDVFSADGVRFRGNDPWYHMRLVDGVVEQFPHRIGYDPYLRFPGGQEVGVAPFFDLLVGLTVLVAGAGSPSASQVDTVAAFVPPVLGALIVLFVYLLGRRMFSRTAGLFAAALVGVFPGALFARSLLGYVDHHVAEVLLSTAAAWLLLTATEASGRRAVLLAAGAGLTLTAYLATWRGGGLFVLVLVGATVLQLQLDQYRRQSNERVVGVVSAALLTALTGVAVFAPSLAAVELHVVVLSAGIGGLLAMWGIARFFVRRGGSLVTCSVASATAALSMIGAFSMLFPGSTEVLREQAARVFTADATVPVVEATRLLESSRFWPLAMFDEFTTASLLVPIALVPVAVAAWRGVWARTLLLTWFAIMWVATLGQVRYAYYLAVPVALLAGLACERILAWAGRRQEVAFIALAVLVFVPNVQLARQRASIDTAPSPDWHETLTWLHANTPEPFADPGVYYERYDGLSTTNLHPMSGSAYGIMSWWDPGYWIIRIGRRIPTANPTQTNVLEVATFFAARREEVATAVLDEMRSRYVIVDSTMPVRRVAGAEVGAGLFETMADIARERRDTFYEIYHLADAGGQLVPLLLYYPAYYETMMSRLYAFAGEAYAPRGSTYVVRYTEEPGPRGEPRKIIDELRPFTVYEDAVAFVESSQGTAARIVGVDPLESCVPLAPLQSLALVHRSPTDDPGSQRGEPGAGPARVQVFEYRMQRGR